MKKIIALVLLCFSVSNCEKDDICPESTPTTPRLYIEFYNNDNPANLKNVPKLRVQGVGNAEVLEGYDAINKKDLLLPLKTTETSTQYKLHRNYTFDDGDTPEDPSDDIIGGNEDIITITYDTEEVYVSRACGYKTIFKNLTINTEDDGDKWIIREEANNDNLIVENETAAHYKIYH